VAKRHKSEDAEPEEDYQFIPPDFDEDQFIHKEMVSFHTTTVLFVAGIVAALISWGIFAAVDGARTGWALGLVVVAVVFALLRLLFRVLRIDISHWARREWIGTAFLLFFTWLALFIAVVNPPLSDFADPHVDVYLGAAQEGGALRLDLFFTDNDALNHHDFSLSGPGVYATSDDLKEESKSHFIYILEAAAAGQYAWTASATDVNGRTTIANGTIDVRPGGLDVDVGDLTRPTEAVFVRVPDGMRVWAVYAQLETGERVYLKEDKDIDGHVAYASFKGWHAGENNFTIHVEGRNRFHGPSMVPGPQLTAGPYQVTVANPGDNPGGMPRSANPTEAPAKNVPGPAPVLLLAGLVAVAWVARRRQP